MFCHFTKFFCHVLAFSSKIGSDVKKNGLQIRDLRKISDTKPDFLAEKKIVDLFSLLTIFGTSSSNRQAFLSSKKFKKKIGFTGTTKRTIFEGKRFKFENCQNKGHPSIFRL